MLRGRVPIGRFGGISVGVHWSALVIFALIVQLLGAAVLPAAVPGRPPAAYWSVAVGGSACFLVSLLAHELAHALVARRYGLRGPADHAVAARRCRRTRGRPTHSAPPWFGSRGPTPSSRCSTCCPVRPWTVAGCCKHSCGGEAVTESRRRVAPRASGDSSGPPSPRSAPSKWCSVSSPGCS